MKLAPLTFASTTLSFMAFLLAAARPAHADPTVWRRITYASEGVRSLAAGDLDGDGKIDLLWTHGPADSVLWSRHGNGTEFESAVALDSSTPGASDAHPIDLDGDGDLDIVTAARGGDRIAWHENLGGGIFGPAVVIDAAADGPLQLALVDLDGDGDEDLVATCVGDGRILAYPRLAGGPFGAPQTLADFTGSAFRVEPADVDGDGDADLVTASSEGVAWIENLGAGSFAAAVTVVATADDVLRLQVRDLNSDGAFDVVYSERDAYDVRAIAGDGNGGFGAPRTLVTRGGLPGQGWTLLDIDLNGVLDLVVHGMDQSLRYLRNNGAGVFHDELRLFGRVHRVRVMAALDLSGDGYEDLVTADIGQGEVAWFRNDAAGLWASVERIGIGGDATQVHTTGDIDGDGIVDLLVLEQSGDVLWARGLGGGDFAPFQASIPAAGRLSSMQLADVDGDGDLDLVTGRAEGAAVALHENLGGAQFGPAVPIAALEIEPLFIELGDVEGDGDLDLVWGSRFLLDSESFWHYHENLGGLVFANPLSFELPDSRQARFGDLDGDGLLDLLVAGGHLSSRDVYVARKRAGAGFDGLRPLGLGAISPQVLAAGDLDGDGDVDLVTSNAFFWGELAVFSNLGGWTFGPPRPLEPWLSTVYLLECEDLDGDGDLDLVAHGNYFRPGWLENDGTGGLVLRQGFWSPGRQEIADVDGDGLADVVSCDSDNDRLLIRRNRATGFESFCRALPNSLGLEARLEFSGSNRASDGTLVARASSVPDGIGLFVHGATPAREPFGGGRRCVAEPVVRGDVVVASGGVATKAFDNSSADASLGAYAGALRFFQYWYRDPQAGGASWNTSDGCRLYVLP